MAFPATPSNNQVHNEGNRAFVYDSTLGTWDQVRETDRISAESGGGVLGTVVGGSLSAGVTFPAGHVLSCDSTYTLMGGNNHVISGGSNSYEEITPGTDMSITVKNASSKILIHYWSSGTIKDTGGRGFMYFRRQVGGASATTMGGFSDNDKGHGIIEYSSPAGAFHTWGGFHEDIHGQPVGTVLKYYVRIYNNTAATFYFCIGGAAHGGYIMEVMQ